jgi:hypothetical protein
MAVDLGSRLVKEHLQTQKMCPFDFSDHGLAPGHESG